VDPGEELIEAVREKMDELTGGQWPQDRFARGKLEKDQHDRPPRISWVEVGGEIRTDGPQLLAGVASGDPRDASIATDFARYQVAIWHDSVENCRRTLHLVYLAVRKAALGPNIRFGGYEWMQDGHTKAGRKLVFEMQVHLPVPAEVLPTAPVAAHEHEVSVNDEAVC
jgi:hypothetical protein